MNENEYNKDDYLTSINFTEKLKKIDKKAEKQSSFKKKDRDNTSKC